MLTIGRQEIHISSQNFFNICYQHKINGEYNMWCEPFFTKLGFKNIDSIDYSNYENCKIIHNMNLPISDIYKNKYDYIYDGGTIEHIFNIPQVLQNIIDMLTDDGIFLSVTCNNNFSGHGFYQFSPELFFRCFSPDYGMTIEYIFLAENPSSPNTWILCKDNNTINNKRITDKINTQKEVYIIIIAKKIKTQNIKNLLIDYPFQYNYEKIDWK
jgi:SAM-dependent methyltransferase